MKIDSITLKTACETDVWKMAYIGDPNRNIQVTMSYADLPWITKKIEEAKQSKAGEQE